MWSKLKEIFSNFASIVITIILLAAIVVAGIVIANKEEDKKSDNNPEVAQIFEPSISTPLPPDVNEDAGKTEVASTEDQGKVAGDSTTETKFVAPPTGVNPNNPIPYENSKYGISITVPAHTNISEQNNLINFGNLFYIHLVESSDSLEQISKQLSASSEVNNIQSTTLSGKEALKFTLNNETGYVLIKNNQAYYLIGQDKYLSQIKL
jgi:hypothetical protein